MRNVYKIKKKMIVFFIILATQIRERVVQFYEERREHIVRHGRNDGFIYIKPSKYVRL